MKLLKFTAVFLAAVIAALSLSAAACADTIIITVSDAEIDDDYYYDYDSYSRYSDTVYLYPGQKQNVASRLSWKSDKTKWSSSDKTVAKVANKGTVTALKPGVAEITAKYGKKKQTIYIVVNNPASVSKTGINSDTYIGFAPSFNIQYAKDLGAEGYLVLFYNKGEKKWETLYYSPTLYDNYYYCKTGLEPNTEYSFNVMFCKYNNDKAEWLEGFTSKLSTEKEKPHITKFVKNSSGTAVTVAWDAISGADGYQIEYTRYYKGYSEASWSSSSDYMKTAKTKIKDTKCSLKLYDTDEDCSVRVRAYKKVKGKTKYTGYSDSIRLNSMEYIINNYLPGGTPLKVTDETDMTIVANMKNACLGKGLTPYQMVYNIFTYVQRLGDYEYDLDAINSDPLKALVIYRQAQCYQWADAFRIFMGCAGIPTVKVVGGTKHGANHWWVELQMNGTTYLADPYPGSRFFTEYDDTGYYTKIYG